MVTWDRIRRAAHLAEDRTDPLPTTPEVISRACAERPSMQSEHWVLTVDERLRRGQPGRPAAAGQPRPGRGRCHGASRCQRHGHGRRLLDHALGRVAARSRHQVVLAAAEPADGSTSRPMVVLAAAGGQRALGEARHTLDVAALGIGRLSALAAEATAAAVGYQLVTWAAPAPSTYWRTTATWRRG